ncbi:FtsK/SpoIIIE domain-containing protein [Aliarcobacter cryaerophilus]|uniref:FtsK/SpoIIIE domain-containing protein n=1 Tax=Aliarcobacter cryaerophilus TaxID=28198 RepID=UPI0021B1C81C|nr:FtsK/SpoIIIE domain-containing protein [Aliarcobacter cryaerophilus]MCT7494020.1 FtsK/SpoIIIE domain-containing protein [Aliarcobacter cryaerophilus]
MINLNTFQTIILKFYILPILIIGFIFSYNTTYVLSKFFVNDSITINKSTKEIKEIQRRNIVLNGTELKKWTTLTQNQRDFFINNEKEKLENKTKFKIKYENITTQEKLINNMDNYNFFYFLKVLLTNFKFGIILLFCIPFYFLYVFYKKYYLVKLKPLEKFYNLPFYMSSLNSTNNIQNNNSLTNIKNMDKFLKFDEKEKKYLYKTNSILQRDLYINNKEKIEKYLGIQNLKVEQEDLIIKLGEKTVPKKVDFDESKYQKNVLFLGKTENGKDVNLDINSLKHSIIIGESGSGKSVFVQNILLSIFKNLDKYQEIFLIDFKLVEMMRYTKTNEKIKVVSNINNFVNLVEELNKIMFNRYRFIEKMGLTTYSGKSILVFIDEFATIENNNLDKKTKEKMINNLINLLQKSRRSKIFFIFSGQKRDTQNINSSILSNIMSKICLKTPNLDNLLKIRGTQEELEEFELSHSEIRDFNKGRMFYKDGDTGEKFLIQSPFFNVENDKHSYFMFKLLGIKEDKIKQKIDRLKYINILNKQLENDEITEEEFLELIKNYDKKNEIEEKKEEEIEEIEEINEENEEEKEEENEENEENILEIYEEKRKKLWEDIKNIKNKEELTEKRKILMLIKKKIINKEIEEIKELFKNF